MSVKNVGAAVIATAVAGAVALGGGALANAATISGTPTAAAVASDIRDSSQPSGDPSSDTPVTGDELAKVTAAVKAKDSSVTVQTVREDADGSYDVFGTRSGVPVRFEVSADLKTITEGGGHGGRPGDSAHTPVTGEELAKVTAAVKAKDSSVTVQSVGKDADGSYDVFGTRSGAPVRFEVSADLKTITEGGGHGRR
jgi:hypothetical protein